MENSLIDFYHKTPKLFGLFFFIESRRSVSGNPGIMFGPLVKV